MNSYLTLPPAPTKSTGRSGFSLIEVVISLGIVSFVLVALVGLLSNGLQANTASQSDAIQARVLRQTLSMARTNTAGTNSTTFYNSQGTVVAAGDTNAYYSCAVNFSFAANTDPGLAGSAMAAVAATNTYRLQIKMIYPYTTASQAKVNTVLTYASISR